MTGGSPDGAANPFDALLGTDIRLSDVIAELTAARLTVATAESLTGGLLAAALTSVPGSSTVLRGGLVVYATDLKHSLAGVDEQLLADHGPVHPAVAVALADGARRRCGADIGVGLTGVAGPEPQNGRWPGTWYVAVAGPCGIGTGQGSGQAGFEPPVQGSADELDMRHRVRSAAVNAALRLLREQQRRGRTLS